MRKFQLEVLQIQMLAAVLPLIKHQAAEYRRVEAKLNALRLTLEAKLDAEIAAAQP